MEATFRPAPVRRAQTFRLADGHLTRLETGGRIAWSLDLAAVDRAEFVDFGSARAPSRRLDLFAGGERRRVSVNAMGGLGTMEKDMSAFLDLCEAVCLALSESRPGLVIGLGEYGATRWTMFGLGLVAVLGSCGILVAALAGGAGVSRVIEAAVPLGLLMLVGGAIAWGTRPGAGRVQLPPARMAAALKALRDR